MRATARYQAQRHPVATFLVLLILGPYLLAAALLFLILYVLAAGVLLIIGHKG